LRLVERFRQTVPHWLPLPLFDVVMRATTDKAARRARERWWYARRYTCVRDLRRTMDKRTGKKHTKDGALDQAVIELQREGDEAAHQTIANSYDMVRRDLKRRGRESEYYFFVDKDDEGY
jgi:hypothetical protein